MNKFLWIWLRRLFFKNLFRIENTISLSGLSLAVLCLTLTMVVMSSYESTLKESLIAHTGHIHLIAKKGHKADAKEIQPYIQNAKVLPFVAKEALALSEGEISGVLVEGFSLNQTQLKDRLISGSLPSLKEEDSCLRRNDGMRRNDVYSQESSACRSGTGNQKSISAVIGRGLSSRFNLKTKSYFYVSVPNKGQRPQLKKLQVSGIADLGRHELNSRYIAVSLPSAQKLLGLTEPTGFRLFLSADNKSILKNLRENLSSFYWIQGWQAIHKNLFTAIQMEKIIIFVILLILVIAAGFNMSNQMLLQVLKRFHDIGILKTMGASPWMIANMFFIRAVSLSFLGIFLGFVLAVLICFILFGFYNVWGALAPSDVYSLNQLVLDFRWGDFLSIFIFSTLICLLSSWIPIKKALKLSPCEGLRFN